jgi:hypothetical protein
MFAHTDPDRRTFLSVTAAALAAAWGGMAGSLTVLPANRSCPASHGVAGWCTRDTT